MNCPHLHKWLENFPGNGDGMLHGHCVKCGAPVKHVFTEWDDEKCRIIVYPAININCSLETYREKMLLGGVRSGENRRLAAARRGK